MDVQEVSRELNRLEEHYFSLNRSIRSARLQLESTAEVPCENSLLLLLKLRIEDLEQQMRRILREAARVEDSLLE
jgi:hypothetical protein